MTDQIPGQLPLFDLPPAATNGVDPQVSQLREHCAHIQQANVTKYEELLRQGVSPDPSSILMTLINALRDTVLGGPEQPARIQFDTLFETQMGHLLDECLTRARRASLLGGVSTPPPVGPQLIVPQ